MGKRINVFSKSGWKVGDKIELHNNYNGETVKATVVRDYSEDPDPRCVDDRGNNARDYFTVELEDK